MLDLRIALRSLRQQPTFALHAILALALVTAAAAVTFAILHAVVLRPLPYPEPARLVALETLSREQGDAAEPWASGPDFQDLRAGVSSLSKLEATSPEWTVVLQQPGGAHRATALFVSPGLFDMLGARVIQGRLLQPADDQNRTPVAVLSHRLWTAQFGGQPMAGKMIRVDGRAVSVAGVLADGFRLHGLGVSGAVDLWMPLSLNPMTTRRSVRLLKLAGRLAPGATMERAAGQVRAIDDALARQYPETNRGIATRVRPLADAAFGPVRAPLWMLMGFVALLLVVAAANVANLVLARGLARGRDTAVRLALGAAPIRVARLWLWENLCLGSVGAVAGLLLASAALRALEEWLPARLPRREEIGLDAWTLGFAALVSLLTAAAGALAPAAALLRRDLRDSLAQGGRGVTSGAARTRGWLMRAEIALALVLMIGAGLLWRSFVRVTEVNPGFRTAGLVTAGLSLPADFSTPSQRRGLFREIEHAVRAVPGVTSVAAASRLPLVSGEIGSWLEIEGRPADLNKRAEVGYRVVTPNYREVMGIALKRGRDFTPVDEQRPEAVLLVNEALAARYFPGEDPVGRRVRLGGNGPWIEIVGVVGNLRHAALDADPRPEVYRPYGVNPLVSPILAMRAPAAALPGIRQAIRGVNAGIAVYNEMTLEEAVSRSTASRRFPLLLGLGFALIAAGLAIVGLHGVLSQWLLERNAELAIRLALGASPAGLAGLVVRNATKLAAGGLAAGLLLSAGLSRWMQSMLFGTGAFDAAVYGAASIILLLVVWVASASPAWRASRVSPNAVLRQG